MNYDRKEMFSEDATADVSSAAVDMQQEFLGENGTEILNLPDHVIMSPEILKNNICRICATYHESGPKLVPLYLYDEATKPLAKIINKFLPIKVSEDDDLPKFACRECASKLHAWSVMWDSCAEVQKILFLQAELVEGNQIQARNEKSQLTEIVQSVLASYLVNISSMELVCQACHLKTSSEDFHHHLSLNHGDLKCLNDIEEFVRDHVTFEETLESDEDCSSVGSAEASKVTRRFDCSICHTVFSTSSELSHHLRKRNASDDGMCCVNETEQGLKTVSSNLRCKSCAHIAADTDALATHSAQCTASDVTGNRQELMGNETNQKRIPAVCPDCNRTFSNKYNMLNHMKSHRKDTVKFGCECGKSYSTRGNLVAHKRTAHLGELSHRCEECGKGFPTRSARDVHSRLHTGARPFSCSVCARSFRAKNSLDKHRETHAPRRLECALCGRRFRRGAHLRYHVGTHRRRPT